MNAPRRWRGIAPFDNPERGSGTLLGIALMAVVAVAAAAIGLSAGAFSARAHAQGVADVAALAAAASARDAMALGNQAQGVSAPSCQAAAEVTAVNQVHLASCSVSLRGDVTVAVEVSVGPWSVTRHAQAGRG